MRLKRLDERYLIRLERGEEIQECLRRFAVKERIPACSLTGIGATDRATVAVYDTDAKVYRNSEHAGKIEILSLVGNISWNGEEPVSHVHMTATEVTSGVFGGHLVSARVSATVEITVLPFPERITRVLDERIGLPLLDLPPYKLD